MQFQVMLDTPEDVKNFVDAASRCPFEIDLASGNVYIDAKSMLGVMTMALHRRMDVVCIDAKENDRIYRSFRKKWAVA